MEQLEVIEMLCNQYHACQVPQEICWFFEAAQKINPKVVVEIGIYAGGDLMILSTLIKEKDGLAVGIEYDWTNWKSAGGCDYSKAPCPVHLIDGDSHSNDTLEKLKTVLAGRPIDVLFIDGDHRFSGCKQDHEMYGPLVRPGGIIAIHDTQMHRRPDEAQDVMKCGEYWDTIPEPKFEFHTAKRNFDGYGIGYFIK
jgi:cephalosporin hydroxylase